MIPPKKINLPENRDLEKVLNELFEDLYKRALKELDVYYFGDSLTNGSWRLIREGNNLSIQRREAGIWVEKGGFTP